MISTMMDVPLSLNHLLERAGTLFAGNHDRLAAARQVAAPAQLRRVLPAHARAGLGAAAAGPAASGERVATLCWNHHAHLEAYFGIPAAGGVMHTLNLRLAPDEIGWIAGDAQDRFLIVDDILLPLYRQFAHLHAFEKVIVFPFSGAPVPAEFVDYEALLAGADPDGFEYVPHDENDPVVDVLHLGHHRPAQGRGLFAPLDRAAHAGRLPGRRTGACSGTDVRAAGDADVPCQLLGHALRRGDDGREDGLPRARTCIPTTCST